MALLPFEPLELAPDSTRGLLLVLEGPDHSGKSTQCCLLRQYIESTHHEPAVVLSFPDRTTKIGGLIDAHLKDATLKELSPEAMHLLFAANRWECRQKILKLLSEGTNVICDRYAFSGVAYSRAKGLDDEWSLAADKGLPKPDAVIYLDVDIQKATNRGTFGAERYEQYEFQTKVAEEFKTLFQEECDSSVEIVDADKDVTSVHNDVASEIDYYFRTLSRCEVEDMETLFK